MLGLSFQSAEWDKTVGEHPILPLTQNRCKIKL